MEHRWSLWPKQAEVVCDKASPNIIFRGGLGTGKTYVGARWLIDRCIMAPPGTQALVVAPTYGKAKGVNQRDIHAALEEAGITYTSVSSSTDMHTMIAGRKVLYLTGDRPASIIGFTAAIAWHDEPGSQDEETHRRIFDRLREPRVPQLYHLKTGTPEGLGWYHALEAQRHSDGSPVWKVVTATLFDNGAMSEQYVRMQCLNWGNSAMFKSYVLGEATAITGAVFPDFSESKHVRAVSHEGGTIRLGWDFNIHHQTTVCATLRPGPSLAVWGECVSRSASGTSTEAHAQRVAVYLAEHAGVKKWDDGTLRDVNGEHVTAVIDATGASLHTSATVTDMAHIRNAGFIVKKVGKGNPPVRASIDNVGMYLRHGALVFDRVRAAQTAEAVQVHPYEKDSDPPKPKKWSTGDSGLQADHFTDCVRYLCWDAGILGVRKAAMWL